MSKKSGLTKRQKLIIEMLATFNADNPITIQAISEKLKLSSRTVLREMPRINEWFEENDFKLVKKPRIGMYVDEDAETRNYIKELVDMDENKPVYSKADRQMIILLELLTINDPLKYFYFTSLFHISDATLSNDLEEIEKWLDHYNLTLYRRPGMGIYWEGKEEDYRQAVTMVLRKRLRGRSLQVLFEEEKKIKEPSECKQLLIDEIKRQMDVGDTAYEFENRKSVVLVIGVNGVGKTTSVGKLAGKLKDQGKKVIVAAADTYRAAAGEQLTEWAHRAGVDLIGGQAGADPAAIVYDAVAAAKARNADVLLCDTAGRLHNKKNLMEELRKIYRVLEREYPDAYLETLVVLDGTTGQNALAQARQFKEVANVTGIILTKLDGTAKGGIAVAIQSELDIPVKYIGVGESIDDLQKFNAEQFVNALFDVKTEEEES